MNWWSVWNNHRSFIVVIVIFAFRKASHHHQPSSAAASYLSSYACHFIPAIPSSRSLNLHMLLKCFSTVFILFFQLPLRPLQHCIYFLLDYKYYAKFNKTLAIYRYATCFIYFLSIWALFFLVCLVSLLVGTSVRSYMNLEYAKRNRIDRYQV